MMTLHVKRAIVSVLNVLVAPMSLPRPADAAWPGADAAFSVLEHLFNFLFTMEVALKLYFLRTKYLRHLAPPRPAWPCLASPYIETWKHDWPRPG